MSNKKNPIWEFFEKLENEKSKAKCKICEKKCSLGSDKPKLQTVFGLKSHLSTHHQEQNHQYLKRVHDTDAEKANEKKGRLEKKSTSNIFQPSITDVLNKKSSQMWPDDHPISQKIDKTLMDIIVVDMMPYSFVEGAAFKRLNLADPSSPCRYRYKTEKYFRTSLMPATYDRVHKKVCDLIAQAEWISFTTDVWSNPPKSCSLLSFTSHFILGAQRLKVVLGAAVLEENHTGAYIATKLLEIANSYNITGKIHLSVRDNAANMGSATRIASFASLGCVSHTLQLVINDAIFLQLDVENIVKKSRKIVGHFKRSEQAHRRLTELQKTCSLPQHTLIQDVETRWNSTFLMLERLVEQKNAVNLFSVEYGGIQPPDCSEWIIMENIVTVLKSFYQATLELSYDSACASIIIPLLAMLTGKLKPLPETRESNDDDDVARILNDNLLASLNSRFSYVKNTSHLMCSTLLDPRFKNKYLTSDEIEGAKQEICNFLMKLNSDNSISNHSDSSSSCPTNSSAATGVTEHSCNKISSGSLWEAHDNSPDRVVDTDENKINIYEQALSSYLSESRLQRDADIFAYWNSSPFPVLRSAAVKYLSAPPTSVSSEQVFSSAGQIYADRRSNLLGENAEKLLFLAYNIRLFNFDY